MKTVLAVIVLIVLFHWSLFCSAVCGGQGTRKAEKRDSGTIA